jgi:hypothetical protein
MSHFFVSSWDSNCAACSLWIIISHILGRCLIVYGSGPPLTQRHNKRGASRGTVTNVRRAHSAPTKPNDLRSIKGALKRGDWFTLPPTPDRRPTTLDSDPHRRHIFVLVGPRYTLVVPRP